MRSLRELLYNAGKYSDGKDVNFQITRTDTMVRFIVEDTGKGIAEADQQKIFERFVKLDEYIPGTGLGLSVAKSHAGSLGGAIGVESRLGEGSTFWLDLPLN
jgi:signal transduction histidine kinase